MTPVKVQLYPDRYSPDHLFEDAAPQQKRPTHDFDREAVRGLYAPTRLAKIFFSGANIDVLQDALRGRVHRASGGQHVIRRQSDVELKLVMRATFLEHARHGGAPDGPLAETRRLNGLVLDACAPRILREIELHTKYCRDLDRAPMPLDRGQLATVKGSRTLALMPR
jgi:hypothetical protein